MANKGKRRMGAKKLRASRKAAKKASMDKGGELSGYAIRLARRRSLDEGRENPRPLPLSMDYVRPYVAYQGNAYDSRPMHHESVGQIAKYRRPFVNA